jgi:glucuronate isomerase
MKHFISQDFLLQTETAKSLYHEYAKDMPIYDYHCHLPVKEIADNKNFENLTTITSGVPCAPTVWPNV